MAAEIPSSPATATATAFPNLQFAAFQPSVDEGFWQRFSPIKLDALKTDESPFPITGFYAPCSRPGVSNCLTLLAESLPPDPRNPGRCRGNRNRCPVPGTLYNTNTLEGFNALDRNSLLKLEAKKILEDICSGRVEEDCALLSRFIVLSFADLKKHSFRFLFGFPALVLRPAASLVSIEPALTALTLEEVESLSTACNEWRNSSFTTEVPFFLVSIGANSRATIRPLKDWELCQDEGQKLLFGFYDPCHLPRNPGWPLRNFLTFICLRWKMEKIRFFCYREKNGFADLGFSLIGEAFVSVPQGWSEPQFVPEATGWELNKKHKLALRCINLAESMDPERLANSAAALNLKLMKWRALPSLNLNSLYTVKCLVLGAGALGCQVARMLMAWGVRKITMVDGGQVSLSDPLRQSLYISDDSLNGGDMKAVAAARRLKSIFPAVEAEGIALAIPMLGRPVLSQDEARVLEDCKHLQTLITSHDVIFLMTDTRESRWLPTLLCASENKIAITAALGFDSYLVMRHGARPTMSKSDTTSGSSAKVEDLSTTIAQVDSLSMADGDSGQRLGCCFCKDIVGPIDSVPRSTLNQQCMVSRPGLAPIASALAVELMVGILHHPYGINAPGEIANSITSSSEEPLGMLPHQIRGSLPQLSILAIRGYSSNNCSACCSAVVYEYRRRGMEFILQAINSPTYLENVARLGGLTSSSFKVDCDSDADADADVIDWKDSTCPPKFAGPESNRDSLSPLCINLAGSMDPERLAIFAPDLNLRLMKHTLPSLDLNNLSTIKCLLLGAGTLGCQVARMLMVWGVRKITLLDSGQVAMSNPVRQSLYTFDDCLNHGAVKAIAAARSLKHIMPSVEAEGIELSIPMPGHPISSHQEASVLEDCNRLQTLIGSHDVIFLLTDTRESRWLPALLCASENKIAINAALGFDSYLVMRHGAGPSVSKPDVTSAFGSGVDDINTVVAEMDSLSTTDRDGGRRLGCYFCNDVVAPIDSISNRTLDQQCTVTRPGLAPIAAALAVEMMVGILHHPNGICAPGEIASSGPTSIERPLGILPHQIRGSLSQFSQLTLLGYSSNCCTACCSAVVSEYKRRGMEFLVQAINHPTYLEDLTGLTELKESANYFEVDWDDETDTAEDV